MCKVAPSSSILNRTEATLSEIEHFLRSYLIAESFPGRPLKKTLKFLRKNLFKETHSFKRLIQNIPFAYRDPNVDIYKELYT